ncbi:MAG: glycogen debranching enzyme GlgX, partial [Pseudomonadota bacterium]
TINADHPYVQSIIVDSLDHLHNNIGFDGFRFDLASILGRHAHGFSTSHPLLDSISNDPRLQTAKLIAEPWDPGPSGYQLGHFPKRWAEWNDRYRDAVRRFWRGDDGLSGALARRLHGSSDIFESSGRTPHASVNLITAHDGYTLADVVAFEKRHNHANGEDNADGHRHNFSRNYGVEGDTDDQEILNLRRRQRLNMLATLLLSQGTPMLLAGDEFGHSQAGNNNAYAQDNETTWLNWGLIEEDPGFLDDVKKLIHLRRSTPLLRIDQHVHGSDEDSAIRFEWINAAGAMKQSEEWAGSRAFTVFIAQGAQAAAIVINGLEAAMDVRLPEPERHWSVAFTSSELPNDDVPTGVLPMQGYSIALLLSGDPV